MTSELLNTIGLSSNIIGVILIFFFGLPQPSHNEGMSIGIGENTVLADGTRVKDIMASVRRRKAIYKCFACLALCLMLIGFVLQLLSIWAYK